MYVPRAMLMCNRVVLKKAGAFIARPAAVAVIPRRIVTAFIIKGLDAALVWPAGGQSEGK
jgi:hypothetical protein